MRLNKDQVEHARLDMKFHLLIAEASGNSIMPLILNPIHRLMPSIKKKIMKSVPGAKKAALIWHKKVLDAIESRDPQQAYLSMKGHRSEEHTSELQSLRHLVCRLLLEK